MLEPGDIEDGDVDSKLSLIGRDPVLYKGAAGITEDS